jgi:hypothetical protein
MVREFLAIITEPVIAIVVITFIVFWEFTIAFILTLPSHE